MTVTSVAWADVVGQSRASEILRGALGADELGHAWLVVGGAEMGQRELAVALAAALNCEAPSGPDPCGDCRTCRRLLHETRTPGGAQSGHTVLREFYPEGAHHLVDAVREQWLPAASRTLSEGRRRVLRIVHADRMNEAAQNAFLKALEEPPASTLWLLEAEDEQAMLETIVSRCRRLDLTAWTPADLRRRAAELGLPDDDVPALVRAANGSPRRLEEFTQRECPGCGLVRWPDRDGVVRTVVDARTRERAATEVCPAGCVHCPSCHAPTPVPKTARKARSGPKYPCRACGYELASVRKGQEDARPVHLLRDLARDRHATVIRTLSDVGPAAVTTIVRDVVAWAKASAGGLAERQQLEMDHLVEDFGVSEESELPGGIRKRTKDRHKREQRRQQQAAVERFLDELGTWLRDVLVVAAGGGEEAIVNVDRRAHLELDAQALPVDAVLRGLDDIARCREALDEFNGNPELQLERVLIPLSVALFRTR